MSLAAVTWITLAVLFVLGAAPVFVVRIAARIYPKGHPRRRELVAEMQHVAGLHMALARWYWMSEVLALAIWEGVAARLDREVRDGPPVFTVRRPGPATVTIWQGPDRLHFTFEQEPWRDEVLDRTKPADAELIARIERSMTCRGRAVARLQRGQAMVLRRVPYALVEPFLARRVMRQRRRGQPPSLGPWGA